MRFLISDDLAVMRNGRTVFTGEIGSLSEPELIRHMMGARENEAPLKKRRPVDANELVRIEGLSRGDALKDVTFSLKAGEVGSIAYVASALFALIMRNASLPFPAAVMISITAGLALGCINAAIVVSLRVNSLIATLGTMIAFRGLGLFLTDGGLVVLPEPIKALGNVAIGPLYVDTIIALIILLAVQFLDRRTTFGRQLTAIGNNEDVGRRIGIPVDRRTFATLLISGAFAAIAGVIYTLQVGVNTAKIGDGGSMIGSFPLHSGSSACEPGREPSTQWLSALFGSARERAIISRTRSSLRGGSQPRTPILSPT